MLILISFVQIVKCKLHGVPPQEVYVHNYIHVTKYTY